MRILVGGVIQESNTFSPAKSTMDNFKNNVLLIGDELKGISIENEIRGCLAAAQEEQVDIIPTLFAQAVSAGPFEKQAFRELKQLFVEQITKHTDYDGIFLALHGAMVAEDCDDVEGELLTAVREVVGPEVPLVITLDLHANVTEKIIQHVDGLVGFKTFPHIDFFDTGFQGAKLLFSMIREQKRPNIVLRKIPMMVPAENSQTTRGPFSILIKEAEFGEAHGHSLVTSLFPVQPWLDIDEMGFAVVVVGYDHEAAVHEADRLADLAWEARHAFDVDLVGVTEIIDLAQQRLEAGPIVISDSADSPGAGSPADGNTVLKQLMDYGVQKQLSCLLTIVDAAAVAQAIEAGVGNEMTCQVGHTISEQYGTPITIKGIVRRIGDGYFPMSGGYAKNTMGKMGRCVVLQIGKISLLITEKTTFTGDPGMYRSMGLEPTEADIVLVKSANQFRADYEKITNRIYILDTPGPSTANLTSLPFHKIRRPFYPFDDNFDWKSQIKKRKVLNDEATE